MLLETLALAALAGAPAQPVGELTWHDGALSNAVGKARTEDKMVLVYFWMDGSEYCKKLWDETLTSETGQKALGEFVLYSAKHGTPQGTNLVERFNVQTLPAVVFLSPDGSPEDMIGGFIEAEGFVEETARIRRGEGTVSHLRKESAAHTEKNQEAFEARFALADRLGVLGQGDEADTILASIREDDPKGKTKLGCEMHLQHVFNQVAEAGGGDEHIEDWDLSPVEKQLKQVSFDEVRFQGLTQLANVEASRSKVDAACKYFGQAWELCPEDQHSGWAGDVAAFIIRADGERSKKEAKFALSLAKASVEATEALTCEYTDEGCECDICTHPESLVAHRMETLARAYRLNGDDKKAMKIAKQCVELDPEGEYETLVEELGKKG